MASKRAAKKDVKLVKKGRPVRGTSIADQPGNSGRQLNKEMQRQRDLGYG